MTSRRSRRLLRARRRAAAPVRAGLIAGLLLGGVLTGSACAPATPVLDLGRGEVQLAMTDSDLASAIQTWVAALYYVGESYPGCAQLLDLNSTELEFQRQRQPTTAAAAAFTLSDERSSTDFGRVEPPGLRALVMLGSTRPLRTDGGEGTIDPGEQVLPQLSGSVVAIGCRELEVTADRRFAADVTLFPAGLR